MKDEVRGNTIDELDWNQKLFFDCSERQRN